LSEDIKKNDLLISWLQKNFIPYTENFDLQKKSWLKCGGIIKILIEPENLDQVKKILIYLKSKNQEYYPIGNLSNTLFRDGQILTPFINLKNIKQEFTYKKTDTNIELNVNAGTSIYKYVSKIQNNFNFSGQEGLIGIPGTVGAAIITNASSYGSCISDYIDEISYFDSECNFLVISKTDANFNWRRSIFKEKKNCLIYEVKFILPLKKSMDLEKINMKVIEIKKHRSKYQEKKHPNLGSLYATKNLYYDLSKISFIFFILYLLNIVITKTMYIFKIEDKLILYRKYLVKVYSIIFGIQSKKFSFSDRTINCLVNNEKKTESYFAFELIEKLEKKIKGKIKLENVLVKNIK
tara:strand:+ start:3204 stop:4256 length:1053 start_codon:yes stop_codon:yes gene_type:complete